MKFTLSTDTCCDDFKSNFRAKGINFFSMKFICDAVEYDDNFDSAEDYMSFYKGINDGRLYSTAGVNVEEIKEYFNKLLNEEKKDVIHLTLSSGLSVTYDSAKTAADEINETSENKIYVIDSLSATLGMTLIITRAANYRDQDLSAEETVKLINEDIKRNQVLFFVNDLAHLRRGGRISGAAAIIGKIAGIRPLIEFDNHGKLQTVGKVMGVKKATLAVVEKLKKLYDGNSELFIVHGENLGVAAELEALVLKEYPEAKIEKRYIGPMIVTHTGPSMIGLFFLQKDPRF